MDEFESIPWHIKKKWIIPNVVDEGSCVWLNDPHCQYLPGHNRSINLAADLRVRRIFDMREETEKGFVKNGLREMVRSSTEIVGKACTANRLPC